jgi:hypothetical protein
MVFVNSINIIDRYEMMEGIPSHTMSLRHNHMSEEDNLLEHLEFPHTRTLSSLQVKAMVQ